MKSKYSDQAENRIQKNYKYSTKKRFDCYNTKTTQYLKVKYIKSMFVLTKRVVRSFVKFICMV